MGWWVRHRTSSSSDQLVKDIGCGFVASLIACTIVYPIDSTKAVFQTSGPSWRLFFFFVLLRGGGAAEPTCEVRLQTGRTALPSPEEGGPLALFDGLLLNLGREAGFTAGLWEAAQILICGEHAALPRLESLLLKLKAPNASILLGTFNFLKRAIFNLLLQWLAGNVESFEGQRDQELRPLL